MWLKNGILTLFIPAIFWSGCSTTPNGWKKLDLKAFEITVPKEWKFDDPGEQEDSFVGQISGPNIILNFDCSIMGYANHLLNTEKEYLNSSDWWDDRLEFSRGASTIKVHTPDSVQKRKYPNAYAIADITYKGKTINKPIKIPTEISSQNIVVDSNKKFVSKTIWPKVIGKGMTGIYIHSRLSTFNFQMNARNLSAKNQELVLKAFKTITFPK